MNKQQKDYLFNRINGQLKEEQQKLENEYCIKAIKLTNKEKLDLIYSDNCPPLIPKQNIRFSSRYQNIFDVFDFSFIEKEDIIDTKMINNKMKTLRKEAQKTKDNLILCDTKDITKILKYWDLLFLPKTIKK